MKQLLIILFVLSIAIMAACDVRSDTAKKAMEKYESKPTPATSPTPESTPIDPADIVKVDTNLDGDTISIDGYEQNKTAACTKFNLVRVNGDKNILTIKGVCREIMINGDGNKVSTDAAMEFVLNGSENAVGYSRFANGKRPIIVENRTGNVIEKVSADTIKRKSKEL